MKDLEKMIVKEGKNFKIVLDSGEEQPVTITSPLKENVLRMAEKIRNKYKDKLLENKND